MEAALLRFVHAGDVAQVLGVLDGQRTAHSACDMINQVTSRKGETLLMLAAARQHYDVLALLLERGADPDHVVGRKQSTALQALLTSERGCAGHDAVQCMQLLVASCSEKTLRLRRTVTHESMVALGVGKRVHVDVLRVLVPHVDLEARSVSGATALFTAVAMGEADVVQLLASTGQALETATVRQVTPLMKAAADGREDLVRVLLDAGALPQPSEPHRFTPLAEAARRGHIGVMQLLLDAGASPAMVTSTAAQHDDDEALEAYGRGSSPLMAAAASGSVDAVRLLLSHADTDVLYRDALEYDALLVAVLLLHADVVDVLIEHGADVHARYLSQTSLLHHAASGARVSEDTCISIMHKLLAAGAAPDAKDELSCTPLALLNECGHTRAAQALSLWPTHICSLVVWGMTCPDSSLHRLSRSSMFDKNVWRIVFDLFGRKLL